MGKAEASIDELVSKIERGELRLPEMQRQYVWRSTRVRDLLDSLYRGYPSGAILVWETAEDVPTREFAVSTTTAPYQSSLLLLDGQQRLTSLAAIIRGLPVQVRGRRRPIELLFNLEHPDGLALVTEVDEAGEDSGDDESDDVDGEELEDVDDASEDELQRRLNEMTFVVSTSRLAALPQWVKVSEVFTADNDSEFLRAAGVNDFDDPRYKKYSDRLARLRKVRDYVYRMDVLERSLSYDEVTEIFVRVNSLGSKLRSSDLALAQITAKWRNSLVVFQEFQSRCAERGFNLDLGIHLKNLVAFATGQSRFLSVGAIPVDRLQDAWKESCTAMEFAIDFLVSNTGIDDPGLLSSPFLMVTVGYFGRSRDYSLSPEESDLLRQWVLLANAKGRYSRGSSETLLDQDIAGIRDGGDAASLMDRLRLQVGRLEISPQELEGRNQRSALFKTMFLAFRSAGAKDWKSNLQISLRRAGAQHKLQFHHIFPKAYLRGQYRPREIDDIANLAFIDGRTNNKIKANAPAEYLPPLIEQRGEDQFAAQAIPTDLALLAPDRYPDFLAARRILISESLNEFLGLPSGS
jgi:hypothetical protein